MTARLRTADAAAAVDGKKTSMLMEAHSYETRFHKRMEFRAVPAQTVKQCPITRR